jgi:deoxyribodipyrimidine photo-lyase
VEKAIFWFRRDLRVSDQCGLAEATRQATQVLPVFVIDETITKKLPLDDRRITFIQACLDELNTEFERHGSKLLVLAGDPVTLIPELAKKIGAETVFCNRDEEPAAKIRDAKVETQLKKLGIAFHAEKDHVVIQSRELLNKSGEPYRVFTPYAKAWLKMVEPRQARYLKNNQPQLKKLWPAAQLKIASTNFWKQGFAKQDLAASAAQGVVIEPGEKSAKKTLKKFKASVAQYQLQRDFPAIHGTSILSTHFRFGTLSIREAVRFCFENFSPGAKVWLSELIWREFYHMILDQFPHVAKQAFKEKYAKLPWSGSEKHFQAWCEGKTGYPLVDAAMRQLNQTGWMHNRLRMVTAMFLTKDLLVDWRKGEAYFALKLLDFDLAANNGGWQWSASIGCDAQPYFRIMNPISQSEKYDAEGDFIRRWVPELKNVESKRIHWPHAHKKFLKVGEDYANPLVDHKIQRQKALKLFKNQNGK